MVLLLERKRERGRKGGRERLERSDGGGWKECLLLIVVVQNP
jgi:hypothetical protein